MRVSQDLEVCLVQGIEPVGPPLSHVQVFLSSPGSLPGTAHRDYTGKFHSLGFLPGLDSVTLKGATPFRRGRVDRATLLN